MMNNSFLLPPKVCTGRLHKENKGALDWGWQGLLAYGAHSCVVIVDPQTLSVVQSLDEHTGNVSCVRWSSEPLGSSDAGLSYIVKLASGDTSGNIIVSFCNTFPYTNGFRTIS